MNLPEARPLGIVDRVKGAAKMLVTGKAAGPNPLSIAPKEMSRAALVEELSVWARTERDFWKPVFDRIKHEQRFSAGQQWPKEYKCQSDSMEPFVGDVMQQMLNRKTAILYAKNPTPLALRRERMEFTRWDGNEASLVGAQALVARSQQLQQQAALLQSQGQGVPPMPPDAMAQVQGAQEIIEDYQKGMLRKALMDRVAQTATLLIKREWELQVPDLVISAKQMITRTLTSRVGYMKVAYRRETESPATVEAVTPGLASDLQQLHHAVERMRQPDFDPEGAEAEKFKLLLRTTADAMDPSHGLVNEEGIVIDFLSATSVIVDRNCRCLREFIGARRIAQEMLMSVDECEARFKISLRDAGAVLYADDGTTDARASDNKWKQSDDNSMAKNRTKVCVWEIQDKETGAVYTMVDGVKDFVREPEPSEPAVRRFWTIVPLVLNAQEVEVNDPENDVTIYPRSDVRLAMPMQIDINVAGEGLREHRVANRPAWVGVRSKFGGNAGENDLTKLSGPRPAHTVLMLDSLNPSEKIGDFIQPLPTQPITREMYDPGPSNQAMMLATGQQASDLGQQAPDEKATGQNIAAQAKASTDSSNIDDIDFAFGTVAQMMWEMCLQDMPKAIVQKKVGQGAAFPDVPAERMATMNEIFLSIEAGSSGRPNQMQEVSKFNIVAPLIKEYMMALGKDLEPLLKEALRVYNSKLDLDEFLKPGQFPAGASPAGSGGSSQGAKESISIKLAELSPEERAQALAKAGIKAGGQPPPAHGPAQQAAMRTNQGPAPAARNGRRLDAGNPDHVKLAQNFIRQAGGNRTRARELAQDAGYQ